MEELSGIRIAAGRANRLDVKKQSPTFAIESEGLRILRSPRTELLIRRRERDIPSDGSDPSDPSDGPNRLDYFLRIENAPTTPQAPANSDRPNSPATGNPVAPG